MRHAILGAGGVGGLIGGCLARFGDKVTLVVRPGTAESYPREIRVESRLGSFNAEVSIAGEVPPVEILWITVKATQLEGALKSVTNPDAIGRMVPLLNGIDHVALLRSKYGQEQVIPGTFAGESERVSRGHFVHRSPFANLNILSAGRDELGATLEKFQNFGFECRFVDNEATLLWGKLVFLAPFALSTTAADKNVGDVLADPHWGALGKTCVGETCAVGMAEGAEVSAEKVLAGVARMPAGMRSSMQKDVESGNPPELDAIAGPVLRGAKKHGIEVPATRELVAGVERRVGATASLIA